MRDVKTMSEEELRLEVMHIREERSGKGRARRTIAHTERVNGEVRRVATKRKAVEIDNAVELE